jgi:hypothetical protein
MIFKSGGSIQVSPGVKRLIFAAVAIGAVLMVYFAARAVLLEHPLL